MIRFGVVLIPALMLAGCMSQQPAPTVDRTSGTAAKAAAPQPAGPGYYTVKRGDTLYRIALEHGQDHRDIAAWNAIANPSSIKEGQVLRVIPRVLPSRPMVQSPSQLLPGRELNRARSTNRRRVRRQRPPVC